jgi:hypothetical protein
VRDPSATELRAYLESRYTDLIHEPWHTESQAKLDSHDGCGCRFDIEEALYYLAIGCHGGPGTKLYSALQESEFIPGPLDTGLPDYKERLNASLLYNAGLDWIFNTKPKGDQN